MVIVNTSELYPVVLDLKDTEFASVEETAIRRTTPTSNTVQDLLYHHPLSSLSSSYIGDSNGHSITDTSNSPSLSSHKRSNSASLEFLFESSSSLSSNTNDYSNNKSSSLNEKGPTNANANTAKIENPTTLESYRTECFHDGYVLIKEIDDTNPISTVWEAIHRQSGLRYAVKIMHKKRFVHLEEQSAQVYHEVNILKHLYTKQLQQHQNDGATPTTATTRRKNSFLKFADFYEDKHYFYIVTEYIHQSQTLTSYIRQQKQKQDEEADCSSTFLYHRDQQAKYLISSLLEAIHELHYEYRICHCNLNTDNILLVPSNKHDNNNTDTFDYSIILCGLGNAEYLDGNNDYSKPYRSQQGERESLSLSAYVAPEMLKNSGTYWYTGYSKPYNHTTINNNNNNNRYNHNQNGCKCDAWSVGVILYSTLTKTLSSSLSPSLFALTRTISTKNKRNQGNPSTSSTATQHHVPPNNDVNKSTTNELFRRFHNREYSSNILRGLPSTSLSFLTKDFLSGLLRVDPKIRMSPQDALLHPWLAEIEKATGFPDSVYTGAKIKGISTGATCYDSRTTIAIGVNSYHDNNLSDGKKKKKKKKTRSIPSSRRRTRKRAKELVDRVTRRGGGGRRESVYKNCDTRIAYNTTSSLVPSASSCSRIQSPQILLSHERLSASHQQPYCKQSSRLLFSKILPKVDEEDCHQISALMLEASAATKLSSKVRKTSTIDDNYATPCAAMSPPVVSPPKRESSAERGRRFWRDPSPSMRSIFNKPSHFDKMSPSSSTSIHQDLHSSLKKDLPSKEGGQVEEIGCAIGGVGDSSKACLLTTSTANRRLEGSSNSISNKERIRRFWKVFAHPAKRADSNDDESTTGVWIQRTQSEESTKTESILSIQG